LKQAVDIAEARLDTPNVVTAPSGVAPLKLRVQCDEYQG
jgi:hypothetical protein